MITSTQNSQVKNWIKLHSKKHRVRTQSFLIEGFHLLEDALNSGWQLESIIAQNGIELPNWLAGQTPILVDRQVFAAISQTEAPQGIAAVVNMPPPKTISEIGRAHV